MSQDYIRKTLDAYDDVNTYEQSTQALVEIVEIDRLLSYLEPNAKILDAGCAYGRDTQYLYEKDYDVEGIDLSGPMIKRAKERSPALTFRIADVRNTGYEPSTFDGIWSNATLLHLNDEDLLRALKEFNRILKSGGILAFSLKRGEGSSELVELFSSTGERFYNFKTIETLRPLILAANFEEIDLYYANERVKFGEDKRDLDWLHTIARKK